MSKKSVVYYFSIILFVAGLFFILNASTNITGAVIGIDIIPVKNAGIGFALIFISTVLFLVEASGLEKKLDFKDIEKKYKEVQNINTTQDKQHKKIDEAIMDSTKGDKGWLDLYKLDTEKGQEKAYKAAIDAVTSKDNPFYKKIDGISKEHGEYISLRAIGLNPFQLKKNIYEHGRKVFDVLEREREQGMPTVLKRELQELPFANVREKDIEDIIDYSIPKEIVLDKPPKTIEKAKELLKGRYEMEGKYGPGQLKQLKYLKKAA